MKKAIISLLIICTLMVSTTAYAEKDYTLEQVESEFVTVFVALLYLDKKLDDAAIIERVNIHIIIFGLKQEMKRLAEIKKELESSQ